MSCPKTQFLLQEYFSDDLAPLAREELGKHLANCEYCNAELESLLLTQSTLRHWQDQRVPHWDRGLNLFRREHRAPAAGAGLWVGWQWLPTAASFAMLAVLLFNLTIVSGEHGFSISFGPAADLQAQLTTFQQLQREEMQSLVTRVEDRQDNSNVQLLQVVLEQTQQSTAENLDRIYAYFEQKRIQDLQDMRVGYQQLVDSDYETIRSLNQLAQFVSYQSEIR